jgi:hypothetical protein
MPTRVQHGKVVDAARAISIPPTAEAQCARNDRIEKTIPTTHVADKQPYHDASSNGHPALKHLKSANHVREVFKKR